MSTIRIAGTIDDSIVDGPGLRYVVFFQGCSHHCPNCHNAGTWDFGGGKEQEITDIIEEIAGNPLLTGITLSGGDPMDSAMDACNFLELVKLSCPHLDVWTYTGYSVEELLKDKSSWKYKLLTSTDVLVDGLYIDKLRDLTLSFRGSKNQRLIDMKATLKANKPVLWCGEDSLLKEAGMHDFSGIAS